MNLKRKRSLRVDSISKHFTVTIAKKKKKPAVFPFGGSHFLLFPSLTRASWHSWGRVRRRKSTLSIQGTAAVTNGPREPRISGCVRLCPKLCSWSTHYVERPWHLASSEPPCWSRAAEPRGKRWYSVTVSRQCVCKPGGGAGAVALGEKHRLSSTRHPPPPLGGGRSVLRGLLHLQNSVLFSQ